MKRRSISPERHLLYMARRRRPKKCHRRGFALILTTERVTHFDGFPRGQTLHATTLTSGRHILDVICHARAARAARLPLGRGHY